MKLAPSLTELNLDFIYQFCLLCRCITVDDRVQINKGGLIIHNLKYHLSN